MGAGTATTEPTRDAGTPPPLLRERTVDPSTRAPRGDIRDWPASRMRPVGLPCFTANMNFVIEPSLATPKLLDLE